METIGNWKRSGYCAELSVAEVSETVTLMGWVHRRRDLGSLIFIWLRDRSGMVQVVADLENQGNTDGATSVVRLTTLDSASLPGAPSSPNVKLALALGLLVGFAAGIAYALIKAALDRRLRTGSGNGGRINEQGADPGLGS